MILSEFCIRRPVFTTLLMISMIVGGIAGYMVLPVNSLPDVDFPTIQVTANLPGASPETMASTVATPLERQFATISGVTSITSSSYLGTTQVTLQFELSRDLDGAALDVQSAISTVSPRLPKELPSPPSFRKVNPADAPIIFISVASDTLPLSEVNEFADTLIGQQFSTLSGVAQVNIYGQQKYALRIRVNPEELAARGISMDEVAQAITSATSITPAGDISSKEQLYTLQVTGQPKDANSFKKVIVKWQDNGPVRFSDIAEVIDSVEDTQSVGLVNDKRSVVVAVQRQPGANTVEVARRILDLIPKLQEQLPPTVKIVPLFDRSVAIKDSIHDVEVTLGIAIILVILVIFIFLRRLYATIIPTLAIPLSIMGTLGCMAMFGFSLNNISLLAITLSVGFVVDDAIVMLENIVRHIERGEKAFDAALQGAREIGFTIISMTLSLTAVFIPVIFMGGLVGRMFREFSITISCAVIVSGLVSLTLTPMLASRLLAGKEFKPKKASRGSWSRALEEGFNSTLVFYEKTLRWVLNHQRLTLFVTLGTVVVTIFLYIVAPKGFFPLEDNGFIFAQTEADQDVSFDEMLQRQNMVTAILRKNPYVENVQSFVGSSRAVMNNGRIFFGLKPIGQRPSIFAIIDQLRREIASLQGIRVFMQPIQTISLGGRLSKGLYQYTLQSTDFALLDKWATRMLDKISQLPGTQDVSSDLQLNSLQILIDVDQDKAQSLGVSYDEIRRSLYRAFGESQAGALYTASNNYQIILELAPEFQRGIKDLETLYLPTASGKFISLSSIATFKQTSAPLIVSHQGQLPAATISFNLSQNTALSQVVDAIRSIQNELGMPSAVYPSFQGTAGEFLSSVKGTLLLLILAIVVIYIILGMLYESFIHPLTILSGIPSAGIGAILALMLFGMNLDIISMIGIILLVGIVKKNAIMMIDFALSEKKKGVVAQDAIFNACMLRFRPIMMTTFSALFATLPIALGLGAGAELRRPLGVSVVGGLFFSQIITLYITPVVFLYLERVRNFSIKR